MTDMLIRGQYLMTIYCSLGLTFTRTMKKMESACAQVSELWINKVVVVDLMALFQ
jgi:hypothetical protein